MTILKQSVGIDIAKDSFTVCLSKRYLNADLKQSVVVTFKNNKTGFNQLMKWVRKNADKTLPIVFVMEATGTYYEQLAYHLNKLNKTINVVLPNKINHFAKSLNIKSKTDPIDSKVISQLGAERNLNVWNPPVPLFRELRSLTRLYNSLQKDKTMTTNRLGHLDCSYKPNKLSMKIYKDMIKRYDKRLDEIESAMEKLLKSDDKIWEKIENLMTIKGVGFKTIAIIIGETQGFQLIQNQRQLTSYCGLDVVKKESGSSVSSKSKISKKGNSHIRAALYFPALSSSRYNKHLSIVYKRINKNKPNKMPGIVALQRRLLVLIYSIWKSGLPFMEDYELWRTSGNQEERVSSSSKYMKKVDGAERLSSTQNELPYKQVSEALLHL